MSSPMTFRLKSERAPTVIGSLVFLVPGIGGVIVGLLTFAGLTWIDNPANGVLVGATGAIWALVGLAVLRFQRWITVDPEHQVVERGTRTLVRHRPERFPLGAFRHVEVVQQSAAGTVFYSVALSWKPGERRGGVDDLWLESFADAAEARGTAERVASSAGLPLVDRTRGELPS